MLSRTALNLFWLGRYVERAETVARLLEVGQRNTLMPSTAGGFRNEWDAVLRASGTNVAFHDKYGDTTHERDVETHMFFDRDNPSSITACLEAARENGRIVRTHLTSQLWDALNQPFQELREMHRTARSEIDTTDLTDWTLKTCTLIKGAAGGTLLHNDAYHFLNAGFYLERGDATARLLDVKYYVLLPGIDYVGSGLDNYQWSVILRALSANRAFNWAYGGEVTPAKIVDFLILNRALPRSLISAADGICVSLDGIARAYGRATPAQTDARALLSELEETSVDQIFDQGLHQYVNDYVERLGGLSGLIFENYLGGQAA